MLEFIADLYPESTLLPRDPVLRAKTRFFIDAVSTKLLPAWANFAMRGADGGAEAAINGLEAIQALLPEGKTYAVSNDYTIADAAIAPFLGRLEVAVKNDIGAFKAGEGKKVFEAYQSEGFRKLREYFDAVKKRDSFKQTFDEVWSRLASTKHTVADYFW